MLADEIGVIPNDTTGVGVDVKLVPFIVTTVPADPLVGKKVTGGLTKPVVGLGLLKLFAIVLENKGFAVKRNENKTDKK